MLRINITMDGLDGRVFSFADFDFPTNLPPYGGVCSTASEIGKKSTTKFLLGHIT